MLRPHAPPCRKGTRDCGTARPGGTGVFHVKHSRGEIARDRRIGNLRYAASAI